MTEELINKKASERKFSKDLLFSFTKINHFAQSFREEERRRRKKTFCKSIGSLDLRRMGIFSCTEAASTTAAAATTTTAELYSSVGIKIYAKKEKF